MNPTRPFISLYTLLETEALPEGDALIEAMVRMRRRRIAELELSEEGVVFIGRKARGRNDIEQLYDTDQLRGAVPHFHSLIHADPALEGFLERGWPVQLFKEELLFGDQRFLDFLRPYFFRSVEQCADRSFALNDAATFWRLVQLRSAFGNVWISELEQLFDQAAYRRITVLRHHFDALKEEDRWPQNSLLFSPGLVQCFNALPESAYDMRNQLSNLLIAAYNYCRQQYPRLDYCSYLAQSLRGLLLRESDRAFLPQLERIEKERIASQSKELSPRTRRTSRTVVTVPMILILMFVLNRIPHCSSSSPLTLSQLQELADSFARREQLHRYDSVLKNTSELSMRDIKTALNIAHLINLRDTDQVYRHTNGDLIYNSLERNRNDSGTIVIYSGLEEDAVVFLQSDSSHILAVRYLCPNDSVLLPYDGGKLVEAYLYIGHDWLPDQKIKVLGIPSVELRGAFLHIPERYEPVRGPFALRINPKSRGAGKIVGYARFSGSSSISCSRWWE